MNYALCGILIEYAQGGLRDNVAYVLSLYYARYGVAVAGMGFNIIGLHDIDRILNRRILTMMGGGMLFA